jgi:two-component system chemotaxis response regulator CheB
MSIRVLIIDDSAFMCRRLSRIVSSFPDLEVVGIAHNADEAWEKIRAVKPDVLTLDVQMPGASGLEFLEHLMRRRPMPVVMVSSHTQEGTQSTLTALSLGAVDFIDKPRSGDERSLDAYGAELTEKIRSANSARFRLRASQATILQHAKPALPAGGTPGKGKNGWLPNSYSLSNTAGKVIFLGASTGGTEAIKQVLLGMPANCPPILIVQHLPETFSAVFADNLNKVCSPQIMEAQGDEVVEAGHVYITRGNHHMRVKKNGDRLVTELVQTPPVNGHRPSVDVLFESAATVMGRQAVGIILTGMGKDGAQGLLTMRKAGARTFGQDEASSVVYGMPREAYQLGAVEEVAGITQMASRILSVFGRSQR